MKRLGMIYRVAFLLSIVASISAGVLIYRASVHAQTASSSPEGKTYEVVVSPFSRPSFTDCFRFGDGTLTIDTLGTGTWSAAVSLPRFTFGSGVVAGEEDFSVRLTTITFPETGERLIGWAVSSPQREGFTLDGEENPECDPDDLEDPWVR